MMVEDSKSHHGVPSDFAQIPIVWRYELLKYFRSKRIVAAIAIVLVIMSLIYILPPALGHPYTGTDTAVELDVMSIGSIGWQPSMSLTVEGVAILDRTQIDSGSLELFYDGEPYASEGGAVWSLTSMEVSGSTANVVMFMENTTGHEITATYEWYTAADEFESGFLSFAGMLVMICATFFGADAIVSEFQGRTGYLVFPNPIKRTTLFLGKFAASMTSSILLIGILYGGVAILSLFASKGIDDDFVLSFALAVEYLLAAMAVAYVISSVLKGSTGAIVLTFFMFLMILPIVDGMSMVAGVKVEGSLTFAAGAIQYILYDPYPTDSTLEMPGMTFSSFYPDPGMAALVMMSYAVIGLALGILMFKRKQLVG
jgi:ABC-2 type transport system permease protein